MHGCIVGGGRSRDLRRSLGNAALALGYVSRQDQRGNLTGRTFCRLHGVYTVAAKCSRALRRAYEAWRHISRDSFDVRLKLRVVWDMIGRVVADDVDDRNLALAGIVQVGESIAEPASQMQQRGGGLAGHARVAI